MRSRMKLAAVLLATSATVVFGFGTGRQAGQASDQPDVEELIERFEGVRIYTKPARDAEIGFSTPTRVKEVHVVGGQRVTKGELLIRGDDFEEQALLKLAEIRAERNIRGEAALKAAELAAKENESTIIAFEKASVTQLEVDRARLQKETRELEVEIEDMTFRSDQVQVDRMKAMLSELRIEAPFDGIVDQVIVDVGDSIRDSEPVIRVVDITSIELDVPAPTDVTLSMGLKKGDPAWVLLDLAGKVQIAEGRVEEVSPVANYASRTRRVRVVIDNPHGWPSGLPAWVRFEEPGAEWGEYMIRAASGADGAGDALAGVNR